MSKKRRKSHELQAKQQRQKKWCARICQRIRSVSLLKGKRLQIHFIQNPQKNIPGICAEYTTQKIFEVSFAGKIKEIGKVFVLEGTTENIIEEILNDNYDLL